MRLHMVMDGAARASLHSTGRLCGDRSRISDPSFEPAYRWLADRMAERLPPPPPGVEPWPLWAWRRWRGRSKPRAGAAEYRDLEDHWLVSFDVPPELVLLSDFEAWHHPLNGWYLPDLRAPDGGEAEDAAFCAGMDAAGVVWGERPYPSPFGSRVLRSWERIFVTDGCTDVQATLWCVDEGMVVAERSLP